MRIATRAAVGRCYVAEAGAATAPATVVARVSARHAPGSHSKKCVKLASQEVVRGTRRQK